MGGGGRLGENGVEREGRRREDEEERRREEMRS